MSEIGEGVAALVEFMEADVKCEHEPKDVPWRANLDGSSEALGANLGDKPHASREAELSSDCWPSQAHHLIPHLTLKRHPVADWLKAGDVLYADTRYDVDHENNGKWMPYASSLPEWSVSSPAHKRELMFEIMRLARIQIHQGPHSGRNQYGIGEAPYKTRVAEYLDAIENNGISHYKRDPPCEDCQSKAQAGKVPPRDNSVRHVDRASALIEKDIDGCRIFVSRIAAEFAEAGGFD